MIFRSPRTAATVTAIALLTLAATASADTGDRTFALEFEDESLLLPPVKSAPNGDPRPLLTNLENGVLKTRQVVIDKGTKYRTWLQTEVTPMKDLSGCPPVCADSRGTMAFQVAKADASSSHVKEKVMLSLTDSKNVAGTDIPVWQSTAKPRYIAFDFKLDPTYEAQVGTYFNIHFQMMQSNGHPVFTMETERNGNAVDLVFFYGNDQMEEGFFCGNTGIYGKEFHRVRDFPLGEWKSLVFEFVTPHGGHDPALQPLNPGRIAVDVGNTGQFATTGGDFWSYRANPSLKPYTAVNANCKFVNKAQSSLKATIGVYRSRQSTTQTVFFDNVKFGTTLESVVSN